MTPQITRADRRAADRNRSEAKTSRKKIVARLHSMNDYGRAVVFKQNTHNERQEALTSFKASNPDEAGLSVYDKTGYRVVLFSFLAVYFIDLLLVRASADFLISLGFYDFNGSFRNLLILVVPACLVLLELGISTKTEHARENGSRGQYAFFKIVSALLAIVVPLLGVATYYVSSTNADQKLTFPHGTQLLALAVLSLAAHAYVIFGGLLSRDALSYLGFSFKAHRLQWLGKLAEAGARRATARFQKTYVDYADAIARHNQEHADTQVGAGPFDKNVRTLISRIFGEGEPGARQNDLSANGHRDYPRTVLEAQVGNAEIPPRAA